MFKKIKAFLNLICPFCSLARKFPNSFIGKIVSKHWEKGCPTHKAYLEIYGNKK